MAAPTLSDYQQSNWSDANTASEVTPTVTWASGNVIVVLGMTSDNSATLNTPTATGLTFTALAGTPTNGVSSCKAYGWSATAGSGGSSAITATIGGASSARGIAAFVYSGCDGVGNLSIATGLGATSTQSLIRGSNNSAVVQSWGDWDAVNDTVVTWTPSGQTERVAQFITAQATMFVAEWPDQGTAGTTSYGFTAGSGTAFTAITVEVKGSTVVAGPGIMGRMLMVNP